MQQSPARLVERFYYDLWNMANEAVAWEILHPDFRFRASLGPEKIGPGGFIEYMRLIHTALSGYQCTIQEMLESGERVAARLRFSGVHSAVFFGIPAGRSNTTNSPGARFGGRDGTVPTASHLPSGEKARLRTQPDTLSVAVTDSRPTSTINTLPGSL